MNQAELLRYLVDVLYGEPRFTQDIDVVADLRASHVPALVERFPPTEFHVSEDTAREAIETRGQFNVIHPDSGLKIDVVAKKATPHAEVEFERRQRQPIVPGRDAYFARPEDVILSKLLYVRQGASDRHLRDIAGMLRISGPEIDIRYVDDWAQRLDVADVWDRVRQRADGE